MYVRMNVLPVIGYPMHDVILQKNLEIIKYDGQKIHAKKRPFEMSISESFSLLSILSICACLVKQINTFQDTTNFLCKQKNQYCLSVHILW